MSEKTTKYYVIKYEYAGFDFERDPNRYRDYIVIDTEPGYGNRSGDVITEGWLGTTNDWSGWAKGAFETEDEARHYVETAIARESSGMYEGVREVDIDGRFYDEYRVATYLRGSFDSFVKPDEFYAGVSTEDIHRLAEDHGGVVAAAKAEQAELISNGLYAHWLRIAQLFESRLHEVAT